MTMQILRGIKAQDFTKEFNLEQRDVVILKYNEQRKIARYTIDYETWQKIEFDKIEKYTHSIYERLN